MMNISPASTPLDQLDDAVAVLTFLADVAPALGDPRHGGPCPFLQSKRLQPLPLQFFHRTATAPAPRIPAL